MAKKSIYKALSSTDTKHKIGSSLIRHLFERAFLDLAFNSLARWELSNKSNYIKSLILGRAPSKIIIANIAKCLEYIADESSEDYKYFKSLLDQGYQYVAIDGNNRTTTIYEFLKSEVPVPAGVYDTPVGVFKIENSTTTLKKLPPNMRDWIIESLEVSVCEYVVNSREDLSILFLVVNDGIKLNNQEMRNAIICSIAQPIRDIALEYENSFKYIFKKKNFRRVIDEQVVRLAVYYTFGAENGISKSDLDDTYADNSPVYGAYVNGGKKVIESTLKMVGKYADAGFKDPSTLLNLFMLTTHMSKNKLKIINEEKFFDWFMATESSRLADNTIIFERKRGAKELNTDYAGCCSATSSDFLKSRLEVLLDDLYAISDSIVVGLDPERLRIFPASIRRRAWEKQGGVCPRTGKVIPESEINNHELWAADHVIPYSKGGRTVLSNCELVCKTYNLKKSSKYVEELQAA